jgi:hypothetical protein
MARRKMNFCSFGHHGVSKKLQGVFREGFVDACPFMGKMWTSSEFEVFPDFSQVRKKARQGWHHGAKRPGVPHSHAALEKAHLFQSGENSYDRTACLNWNLHASKDVTLQKTSRFKA